MNAAISMQAVQRGKMARLSRDEYISAAIVIQSWMRMLLCESQHGRERAAIVRLQGYARSYTQRQEYMVCKQQVSMVQSWIRMRVDEQKYIRQRSALIKLQGYGRSYIARQDEKDRRNAAISLQAVQRGKMARLSRDEYISAAIVIQSW